MVNSLNGFDMIVCLTQNAVNAQMMTMSRIGKVDPSRAFFPETIDWKFTNGEIKATLSNPLVNFMPAHSNYQQMTFILPFASGKLLTYTVDTSKNPPTVVTNKTDISGWQVAFTVNLDEMAFGTSAREAAVNSGAITPEAHESLASKVDHLFDVKALILDFTKSNFAEFDPDHTKMPGATPGEQTAISNALTVFFNNLKSPYIIAVNSGSKNVAATATQVAPTLVPSGVCYTVFGNASAYTPDGPANGISTLNILTTTDGHAALPAKPNGIFQSPFITDNLNSGQLLISRASLVENFLLKQLGQRLGSAFTTVSSVQSISKTSGPTVKYHKEGTFFDPGTVNTSGTTGISITASLSQDKSQISLSGIIETEATFSIDFIWNGTWKTWRSQKFNGMINIMASPDNHSLAVEFKAFQFKTAYRPRKDEKNTGADVDNVLSLGTIDSVINTLLNQITSNLTAGTENLLRADQAAVPNLFVPPTGNNYSVTPTNFDSNGDFVVKLDIETSS